MSTALLTVLSVLSTVCAIAFGYLAFLRGRKQDDNADGKAVGTILTELGYIKGGIDDLKAEQRQQREINTELVTRLTVVEESVKSAHKRIDEWKKTEGKQ